MTRHPEGGDELQTHASAVTPHPIVRPIETAVASVNWSRDTKEWRDDSPTDEETDLEQPDTAPGATSGDTDDSADPAPGATADEEETTASSDDMTDSDDDPADR